MPFSPLRGATWETALCCLGALLLCGSATADPPPEKPAADPPTLLLKHLRKICAREPALKKDLRGVFLRAVKVEKKGTFLLEGFYDDSKQLEALRQEAAELIKDAPAFKGFSPIVDTSGLHKLSLRSKLLPRLRREFAAPSAPDPEVSELLALTRLDDVYYHPVAEEKVEIVFTGICMAAGADLIKEGEKIGHSHIKKALKDFLLDLAPKELDLEINVASIRFVKDPRPEFQNKFVNSFRLDNVLFHKARFGPEGQLALEGWVDKEIHSEFLKLFNEHFKDHPTVAGPVPTADLDGMKPIPWRVEVKKWNEELNREEKHRRTHLERLYFQYFKKDKEEGKEEGGAVFLCLCAEALFDKFAVEVETYESKLTNWLKEKIDRDWSSLGKDLNKNVKITRFQEYGARRDELQVEVIKALGLDQVLLEEVRYDSDGVFEVHGLAANPEQRKMLADHLERTLRPGEGKARVSVEHVRVENWDARLKSIQQALALDPDPFFREIRLDRLSFGLYKEEVYYLEIRFAGVYFNKGAEAAKGPEEKKGDEKKVEGKVDEKEKEEEKEKKTPDRKKKLEDRLLAESYRVWPSLENLSKTIPLKEMKPIDRPEGMLQERVREVRALDGVWLNLSYYDREGKLVLKGFRRDAGQDQALLDFAQSTWKDSLFPPDKHGLALALDTLPTDKVLLGLRRFAAAKLEEVLVDRLFFNPKGELSWTGVLSGEDPKADQMKVDEELSRLKNGLRGGEKLKIAGPRALPKASLPMSSRALASLSLSGLGLFAFGPEAFGLELDEIITLPSLVKHLREKVLLTTDPRWDGVLINRGFFGESGRYTLEGLVDKPAQRDLLKAVLKELAADLRFDAYFKFEPELETLEEMPLCPMMTAFDFLLPEYVELDRIRLDRAYHVYPLAGKKTEKKLEFLVYSTEAKGKIEDRRKEAELILENLLRAHPTWRARVGNGVQIKVQFVPRDDATARLALAKALVLLTDDLPGALSPPHGQLPPPVFWGYLGCRPVMVVQTRTAPVPPKAVIPEAPALPSLATLEKARKYLDTALFHLPEESTAWFLRGATFLAARDTATAARDLRRMNKLEQDGPEAKEQRLLALQLFQGPLRISTSERAAEEGIATAYGRHRLSLARE